MPALGDNNTPFPGAVFEQRFYNGVPYDCMVLKATFALKPGAILKPLAEQPDLELNDLWAGEELRSELLYPSDLIPYKPATDVMVVGTARPEGGQACPQWLAQLYIEHKLNKIVRLLGPREWQHQGRQGWQLSPPTATDAVPLRWQRAWGGMLGDGDEPDSLWPANPLGMGFLGPQAPDPERRYPAPQLELPDQPLTAIDQPIAAAGFMPVPGCFAERLALAGTYDEQWEKNVAPNIPFDMDLGYWNCAPRDQIIDPYLNGDETLWLVGLLPTGRVSFRLPGYDLKAILTHENDDKEMVPLRLDTVLIDLDRMRVTLRWGRLIEPAARIVNARFVIWNYGV